LYVVLMLVYVTGVAWIVLHYAVNVARGPDDAWRSVETWTLRVHGAAAMAALVAAGSVLAVHVPTAWTLRQNRASGLGMLALLVLLAVTGWLLYYAAGESIRAWSGYIHMVAGAAGPLALQWHLVYRRRISRARPEAGQTRPAADECPTTSALSRRAHKNPSVAAEEFRR
jgi:hypothetical protein